MGAGYAQLLTELGPEQILAAVTARERQICRPVSTTERQVGDDPRILVIRMRCDVQHAAHRGKPAQLLQDIGAGRTLVGATEPGAADQQGCTEAQRDHSAGPPCRPTFRRACSQLSHLPCGLAILYQTCVIRTTK